MKGISKITGKLLKGNEHVKQSIIDILTTPIGSRVMQRDYGSRLFELVDQPINQLSLAKILTAIAESIDTWESRVSISQIKIKDYLPGKIILDIEFDYLVSGERGYLEGVTI